MCYSLRLALNYCWLLPRAALPANTTIGKFNRSLAAERSIRGASIESSTHPGPRLARSTPPHSTPSPRPSKGPPPVGTSQMWKDGVISDE